MAGMLDLSEFEKIMITMLRALMEKIDNMQKNRTCKQGDGNSKNQKEMLKIKKNAFNRFIRRLDTTEKIISELKD